MSQRVISRNEALSRGLKRFFTGKPCNSGHRCERRSSNGSCITCSSEMQKLSVEKKPGHYREKSKKWRESNYERHRENVKRWRKNNPERVCFLRRKSAAKNWEQTKKRNERNALKRAAAMRIVRELGYQL